MAPRTAPREQGPSSLGALDTIGIACARAASVALVLGVIEGLLLGRAAGGTTPGMTIAVAGLWVPPALLALVPGALLVRLADDPRRRRVVAIALLALVAVGALLAWTAPVDAPSPWRALPLELSAVVGAAWGVSRMRFEDPFRRPAAYVGIALAVLLQLFANRWVDAHRALAGLLVDASFIPRLMLRLVLRRFV